MKNFKRTLLVGFIWGLVFFLWWLKGFLHQNWNFDIFSKYSWTYLYNEFVSGWVVSATSDWVFIWTLLLAVPLFFIGWNLFLKISWLKSVGGIFKNALYFTRKKTAIVAKKKFKYTPKKAHQKVRPQPLYTTMKSLEKSKKEAAATPKAPKIGITPAPTFKEAPQSAPDFSQMPPFEIPETQAPAKSAPAQKTSSNSMPSFLEDDDFSNMSLDDIHLPEREKLNENISDILLSAGYKVVADVMMDEMKCDFIGVDETSVFVLMSDTEQGDWLADEELFNGEEPLWFSESSHRVSPVYGLKKVAGGLTKRLRAKGLMQKVYPVLVERLGNIINAEDMQNTWKEQGVLVCRTDVGGPVELPSVGGGIPKSSAPISDTDFESIRSAF